MIELCFVVEGVPSTDHRARSSSRIVRGRAVTRHHKSPEYAAWKDRVMHAAMAARPRGWRLDLRYAVECIGYMPSNSYDADNLRAVGDACQGILWQNDNRVRPITYDYDVDKIRPRLEVQIVAYDPKITRARRWVELAPIGGLRRDGDGLALSATRGSCRGPDANRPRSVGALGAEAENPQGGFRHERT